MPTRADRGFRFPKDKFADELALYENFRYLETYLDSIRRKDRYAATIIIAASDSRNADAAHYKCDGSSDEVTIASAVADLPAEGGEIIFLEGNYDLNAVTALGSKSISLRGIGRPVFDCAGAAFTSTGEAFFRNLEFTGGASGALILAYSGTQQFIVEDCKFSSLTAKSCISVGNPAAETFFYIVGNHFSDITISGGGGVSPNGVIWHDGSGSEARKGVVIGNAFYDITGHVLKTNTTGGEHYLAMGNILRDATGDRDGAWSHNWINGTYTAGDHTGLDHGSLSGLTDDDHTNYVLRNILTTRGDLFRRGASAIERVALGTTGQVLTSDGTDAVWDDPASTVNELDDLTDVTITTPAADEVLSYDGAEWANRTLEEIFDVDLDIGTWTTWSPTTTGLTKTSGTEIARYTQIGTTVHFLYMFILGASSAVTGAVTVTLPVEASFASTTIGEALNASVGLGDAGTAGYKGDADLSSSTVMRIRRHAQHGGGVEVQTAALSSTVPFTWGTGDYITVAGSYEAETSVPVSGLTVLADLDNLADVVITSPADGEVLTYDGAEWVNEMPGVWASWSPTLTNLTIGNGSQTARYMQIGDTVFWYFQFVLGSTSAVGTDPQISIPVAAASHYTDDDPIVGEVQMLDAGTSRNWSFATFTNTLTRFKFRHWTANAGGAGLVPIPAGSTGATAPFTWTTGDKITAQGSYERA